MASGKALKTRARTADAAVWGERLEIAALYLLLLVIAMRPLVSETYRTSLSLMEEYFGVAGGLTSAATAWFDLVIWVAAFLTAAGVYLSGRRWRWSGAEIGFLLLVVAAVISTLFTSNKR